MSDTPFRIESSLRAAERELVRALALQAVALPPDLARAEAPLRGRTVVVTSSAYRSERVAWARFTTMVGEGVEIGNVVVIPDARRALPILGCDWVSVTPSKAMMAFDLSPTRSVAPPWNEELAAWRQASDDLVQAEGLPAFCSRFFSDCSLFTRVGPEAAERLVTAFEEGMALFARLADTAPIDTEHAAETASTIDAYNRAHREDDPAMDMLHHTFGRAWSERFLREVMFPTLPAS